MAQLFSLGGFRLVAVDEEVTQAVLATEVEVLLFAFDFQRHAQEIIVSWHCEAPVWSFMDFAALVAFGLVYVHISICCCLC